MGQLSDLQARVLVTLADVDPPWTLTGGWTLKGWNVVEAACAAGLEHRSTELERFRDQLLAMATGERPGG